MAVTRDAFFNRVRTVFWHAFGEFLCRQIALSLGRTEYWSYDITQLIAEIRRWMNPKIIQTTFSKRAEVLNYAMWEAISHAQVTYAKDKVTKFYPKLRMKIYSLNFDATEQFSKMIEEFLPEYAAVANDFIEKRKGVLASSPPERPASNSKRLTTE